MKCELRALLVRLHMPSLRLGLLLLPFISTVHGNLNVTSSASPPLSTHQCPDGWHFLDEDATCVMFATSEVGDVPWYDGYKACQTSFSELLAVSNSRQIDQIHRHLGNSSSEFGMAYLQGGAWIGEASKIEQPTRKPHLCWHVSRMVQR